jgi:hypothetical protein
MIWYTHEWKVNKKITLPTGTLLDLTFMERGWGNGYVAIPPTHPAYKMDWDTMLYDIDVHGGITYSNFGDGIRAPKNWWVIGFDTSHYGDTMERWPKEAVEAETKRLFCQLLDIELGGL